MKKNIIYNIVSLLFAAVTLTSCEIFGLDYQDSYDFDYNAGIANNKIEMTPYDFIASRLDIFSLLKEAIDYAGMEEEFKQENKTYILPTNTAFNSETTSDKSYFQQHQLFYIDDSTGDTITYAPISMTAYPVDQVREFLLYHIVLGQYTFTNLPAEPTWYKTCASADTAYVNMYLLKDRNPNITFNNFDGHYKSTIKPRTANLYSTICSSYMHVLDSWLDRPKQSDIQLK